LDDLEKSFDSKLELRDRALEVAAAAMSYRLEGMNELRAQLNNERGHYTTAEKMESEIARIDSRHADLLIRVGHIEERTYAAEAVDKRADVTSDRILATAAVALSLIAVVSTVILNLP